MRPLNVITLLLVIVGGLNWGLVGAFDFNLVTAILGDGALARIVYVLVGVSAIWQIVPLSASLKTDEVSALRGRSAG